VLAPQRHDPSGERRRQSMSAMGRRMDASIGKASSPNSRKRAKQLLSVFSI